MGDNWCFGSGLFKTTLSNGTNNQTAENLALSAQEVLVSFAKGKTAEGRM